DSPGLISPSRTARRSRSVTLSTTLTRLMMSLPAGSVSVRVCRFIDSYYIAYILLHGHAGLRARSDTSTMRTSVGAVERVAQSRGRRDCIVNGLLDIGVDLRGVDRLIHYVTGAFLTTRAAIPHLVERRGALVNVSSVNALVAGPGWSAYCSAK